MRFLKETIKQIVLINKKVEEIKQINRLNKKEAKKAKENLLALIRTCKN